MNNYDNNEPIYKKIQNYIFKFTDLLGQGNFSKAYKAENEITKAIVAIKIIELNSLKSKKLEQLMFSQIDILKKLNHSNILKCFEVFSSNRNCYIITELCNGGNLQNKLKRQGFMRQINVENILDDVMNGMLYLAEKNVIHRDIKVANIFMHNDRAKIADFGFAKFTKSNFKDINIGSPLYMSPQGFINNIYGPKTDIWAFGILVYQLLHGQAPFNFCKTQNELKYYLSIPLNTDKIKKQLSQEIKQVILRCLQVDEQKRINTFQLSNLPYFRKKKILQSNKLTINVNNLKIRSNSYRQKFGINVISQINYNTPTKITFNDLKTQRSIQNNCNSNLLISRQPSTLQNRLSPIPKDKNMISNKNFLSDKKEIQNNNNNNNNYNNNFLSIERKISTNNNVPSSQKIERVYSVQYPIKNNNNIKIISTNLSFQQTVNILHYCRLLYKFIINIKETTYWIECQLTMLSTWLVKIMDEIIKKIDYNEIIYQSQNANALVRQKKMKQVTKQYSKKYKIDLINYIKTFNCTIDEVKRYLYTIYNRLDKLINIENDKQLYVSAHQIIMIYHTTEILKKCQYQKKYQYLSNYKDIELFLNVPRQQMDSISYFNLKKKMIKIY